MHRRKQELRDQYLAGARLGHVEECVDHELGREFSPLLWGC